jgi:hypothetical protein
MLLRYSLIGLILILVLIAGCKEHLTDTPNQIPSPKTYLWLFPDSTIGTGVSKVHLHWWGDVQNGLVRGYLFSFKVVQGNTASLPSPDTTRYSWTTKTDTTLLFPLDSLFRRFAVVVRAASYGFGGLPEHAVVRMTPFPFWDKNDNGVFDSGDQRLNDLSVSLDPAGTVQTFPIRNSPPTISLLPNPNDPNSVQKLPDTTYTVVTFGFTGADPDGNNTLASYRIALNDSGPNAQWFLVPLRDTILTLVVPRSRSDAAVGTVAADVYAGNFLGKQLLGQIQNLRLDAENVLYIQVKDVAGEYSSPLRLPGTATEHWFVKKPRGHVLLVSDYLSFDAAQAQSTYLSSLANVGGELASVDRINFGLGLVVQDKADGKFGTLVPQYVDPALIQTFLLYDYVIWYTDQYPSLGVAQLSLFNYLQKGGRVIFSTMFLNSIDPRGALRDFAPIDSISSVDLSPTRPLPPPAVAGDSRVPASYIVYPDSSVPSSIYPRLAMNVSPGIHSIFLRPVYKRADARYLYHLQADTRSPQRYYGTPNIAVVDGSNSIIFVGLPLHLMNNTSVGNPKGITAFFEKVLGQFAPSQRVNRAVF